MYGYEKKSDGSCSPTSRTWATGYTCHDGYYKHDTLIDGSCIPCPDDQILDTCDAHGDCKEVTVNGVTKACLIDCESGYTLRHSVTPGVKAVCKGSPTDTCLYDCSGCNVMGEAGPDCYNKSTYWGCECQPYLDNDV